MFTSHNPRIPSASTLCRPYPSCFSFFEFTCAVVLLCLEGPVSSVSSMASGSFLSTSTGFSEPGGSWYFGDILVILSIPRGSCSRHLLAVDLSSKLLQDWKILCRQLNKAMTYNYR